MIGHPTSRAALRRLALMAWLALCGALAGSMLLASAGPVGAAGPDRPNIVVIMTDDQTARSLRHMPRLERSLVDRGTTFTNSFASFPLCCPSRATFLSGQYAHNTRVQGNGPGDNGGYQRFEAPTRNIATWLGAGGYATAHVGKFVYGYRRPSAAPGWTHWNGYDGAQDHYYDYSLVTNSGSRHFGSAPRDYSTTVLTRFATKAVQKLSGRSDPFFLNLAYTAPHGGWGRADAAGRRCGGVDGQGNPKQGSPQPAPRDAGAFANERVTGSPAFNEKRISDKTSFIARQPRLGPHSIDKIEQRARCRLAALRAVDRGVVSVVDALQREDELGDTVIFFTSDNGVFDGEHRIHDGKNLPYDEATAVPLVVRGPGIDRGERVATPVVNVDLAPTILDLAGVAPPAEMDRPRDGRSFAPSLDGGRQGDRAVLIEGRNDTVATAPGVLTYQGVRTQKFAYFRYFRKRVGGDADASRVDIGDGQKIGTELYNVNRDPHQLRNRIGQPGSNAPRRRLGAALGQLDDCEGAGCVVPFR